MWSFFNDPASSEEKEAVDPGILADMIEAEADYLESDPNHVSRLTPTMLRIAAEFLSGKRKPPQRGRPKMSPKQRAQTPTHMAAMVYPAVRKVLKEEYPEQTADGIRDRALYIAARMYGAEGVTVAKYMNQPKRDPRRI
jgi:hypothetical protein